MSTHEEMLSAFVAKVAAIQERLDELKDYANDHLGYAPQDITWAHVGTAETLQNSQTERIIAASTPRRKTKWKAKTKK